MAPFVHLGVERDWGWAPDYADAIWRIASHEAPGDFIVATGKTASLQNFVEAVFSTLGLDWSRHVEIDAKLLRPSEIPRVVVSPARIAEVLDWRASITMPDLARVLLLAEANGDLGPVSWEKGKIPGDGRAITPP